MKLHFTIHKITKPTIYLIIDIYLSPLLPSQTKGWRLPNHIVTEIEEPFSNIQSVLFLFFPLRGGITQRLKMMNAICKRYKIALGRTILPMKCELSILIIKDAMVIIVIGDSISKQTWLKAKYETVWYPVSKILRCS